MQKSPHHLGEQRSTRTNASSWEGREEGRPTAHPANGGRTGQNEIAAVEFSMLRNERPRFPDSEGVCKAKVHVQRSKNDQREASASSSL
jgi:hypothetical protein